MKKNGLTYLNSIESRWARAGAWVLTSLFMALFSSLAWLVVILFAVAGFSLSQAVGIQLPAWAMFLAMIGLPVGAWLELRFLG